MGGCYIELHSLQLQINVVCTYSYYGDYFDRIITHPDYLTVFIIVVLKIIIIPFRITLINVLLNKAYKKTS